jgi:hemin uptake protein HemP
MDTEKVSIEINISSTYWDVIPRAKVKLDSTVLFQGEVNEPITIKHDFDLIEGDHVIEVILTNKDGRRDTIIENGKIVKDMLLTVDSVLLDDIDLGYLITTKSSYDTTEGTNHNNMTSLGWNGSWKLPFTSPVYMWLLENL